MTIAQGPEFESLVDYVRDTRGVDLSGYRRPSLFRRIAKRCAELGLDSVNAYIDYLQVNPDEFPILFETILINVTQFFRDPEAWEHLRDKELPEIISRPRNIRVWSTGTASGEEAYSAAILLCEALGRDEFIRRVKIYATDLDEGALRKARTGYTPKDLESLDEGLRERYFERVGARRVFDTNLRRALIFGRHDLMQDAPISRLDLLICRNTLIYFTAEAQRGILARFHYALNDDGYLFLGRAEMLLSHTGLFAPVDLKQRIFTKVLTADPVERARLLAQFGGSAATENVGRQLRALELAMAAGPHPQIVIDELGMLASANQAARRTFGILASDIERPIKDLGISSRPVALRTAIDRAARDRQQLTVPGAELTSAQTGSKIFNVHVVPLIDGGTVLGTSVTFIDVTAESRLRAELQRATQQVETAYQELESSNEELATTNEELQSTVEELETTNEELQSSNEELETMNEELESTNSELQSINQELRQRTDDVERLNTLLLAITGNIEVGAAVLDARMNVQVWNERAADLWGLRSDEVVGRRFFDLDIGLPSEEARRMVDSVQHGGTPHQEMRVEATTRRGKAIRCRVMVHALVDHQRPIGAVIVMEELKD